jgi:S1-C subfamily serine protease
MLVSAAGGQAPDVPIERGGLQPEAGVFRGCEALRSAGALLSREAVADQLDHPRPAALTLPEPATVPLSPRELYARARANLVRLAWYFKQPSGEQWWLNLADAYPISADGAVVTCYHEVKPDKLSIREGYCAVVLADGHVAPVKAVLAADRQLDTVILRVAAQFAAPLALNDQTAPGDALWLLSDPLGTFGLFTSGIVNRFYWQGGRPGDAGSLEGVKRLRIDVSTDWAPGSSGAAVLDGCGNAVGHVSAIAPLTEPHPAATSGETPPPAPVMITLHEAIPARGVLLLARAMK